MIRRQQQCGAAAAKDIPKCRLLPPRETQHFRTMMKLHDNKQFRKAAKMCDTILKKVPGHGETLGMKGLILSNFSDKKPEAYECGKKGLKLDLSSSMCWHIMGIIYRQDRDFIEAAKCFRHANRLEPENLQILRDLACLQIHKRMLEGHRVTRQKILTVRHGIRPHWTAMAFAHHMCGHLESALKVLDLVEENFEITDGYEASELCLYKCMILEEAGRYEECHELLQRKQDLIRDKIGAYQIHGRLLIYLRRFGEAADVYRNLLGKMPENEDVAFLCLALHPTVRNCFIFPSSSRPFGATAKTDEPCTNEGTNEVAPQKRVDTCTADVKDSAMIQQELLPTESQCDKIAELSPLIVLPLGTRQIGWPTRLAYRWHDSPVRLHPRNLKQLRNTNRTTGIEAKEDDSSDLHLTAAVGMRSTRWRQKRRKDECQVVLRPVGKIAQQQRSTSEGATRNDYDLSPVLELDSVTTSLLAEAWKELSDSFPSSSTVKRLPLYFLSGQGLAAHLDVILRPLIRKFVTAAFEILRPFYTPKNAEVIAGLLHEYENSLIQKSAFPIPSTASTEQDVACRESPMCIAAVWMLLAQHYDIVGDKTKGLHYIDKALEHTPTMVELHMLKGSLVKLLGDYFQASAILEEARSLDLADRYVNIKSTKYLFATHDNKKAEEISRLFSKQSDCDGRHDMQCMWYEIALGRSEEKLGNIGLALTQYTKVLTHFADVKEDQFDFHQYCVRRHAFRAYVDFLRMHDRLESHRFFRRAARGCIKLYLRLHEERSNSTEGEGDQIPGVDKSPTERPKEKAKSKESKQSPKREAVRGGKDKKGNKNGEQHPGDDGAALLKANALAEATRIVDELRRTSWLDRRTHQLAFAVYAARGPSGILVALQSLLRLWRFGGCYAYHCNLAPHMAHFLAILIRTRPSCKACEGPDERMFALDDTSENTDKKVTLVNGMQNTDTSKSGADRNTLIANLTITLISRNIEEMLGKQIRLHQVNVCRSSCTTCPNVKLSLEDLTAVSAEYISSVVEKFAATRDGKMIISACRAIELADFNAKEPKEQTDENCVASLMQSPAAALADMHLRDPIMSLAGAFSEGDVCLSSTSKHAFSLRECEKLTDWLRKYSPAANSFNGSEKSGSTPEIQTDEQQTAAQTFQGPHRKEGQASQFWSAILSDFEAACRLRRPRASKWAANEGRRESSAAAVTPSDAVR